jgi:hypothetical protein
MLSALVVALVVVAVGLRVTDTLRVKQEEIILRRLPEAEAAAYYRVLEQRVGRVRLLRGVTLASLFVMMYVGRRRLFPSESYAQAVQRRIETTEQARALADAEVRRYATAEKLDPSGFDLEAVGGDQDHPWIFDFATRSKPVHRVRVYVNRGSRAELHRIMR